MYRWLLLLAACSTSGDDATTYAVTIQGHGQVNVVSQMVTCEQASCTSSVSIERNIDDADGVRAFADAGWLPQSLAIGDMVVTPTDASGALVSTLPSSGVAIVATFAELSSCTPTVDLPSAPTVSMVPAVVCVARNIVLTGDNLIDPTAIAPSGDIGTCIYVNTVNETPTDWQTTPQSEPAQSVTLLAPSPAGFAFVSVVTLAGQTVAGLDIVDEPTPTILGIAPTTATAGDSITVDGTALGDDASVALTGPDEALTIPLGATTGTTGQFTVPAAAVVPPGDYQIAVVNACGQSASGPVLTIH
jgi:hypothetical protein